MENNVRTNFVSHYKNDMIHITQVNDFIDNKGLYKFLEDNPQITKRLREDRNFKLTEEIFYKK